MKNNMRKLAKENTHQQLLSVTTKSLKEKGIRNTTVDQVMAQLNLTRGSFYAYFKNKEDLVVQSLNWMVKQSHNRVRMQLEASANKKQNKLQTFLDFYLSSNHRSATADGCPIAALARDISQQNYSMKKNFTKLLSETIDDRRVLVGDEKKPIDRNIWIGILSTYIGALVLSRSCEGEPLSDEILKAARDFLKKQEPEKESL